MRLDKDIEKPSRKDKEEGEEKSATAFVQSQTRKEIVDTYH